jgi:hypothetical protein
VVSVQFASFMGASGRDGCISSPNFLHHNSQSSATIFQGNLDLHPWPHIKDNAVSVRRPTCSFLAWNFHPPGFGELGDFSRMLLVFLCCIFSLIKSVVSLVCVPSQCCSPVLLGFFRGCLVQIRSSSG